MFKHQIDQIKHVGIVSVTYLMVIFCVGMFVGRQQESKVLGVLVMLMGASGGVLNNYRRLQQLPLTNRELGSTKSPDNEHQLPSNIATTEVDQQQPTTKNDLNDLVVNPEESAASEESLIIKKSHIIKSSFVSSKNEQEEEFISKLFTMRIYISPLIGAFFAYIVYLIFVGGLVQGSLFPDFQCISAETSSPEENCHNYKNYYSFGQNTRPATNKDMAKLLLWGFIAGFAEGLIPSLIDNMAQDAFQQSREETKISEEKAAKDSEPS